MDEVSDGSCRQSMDCNEIPVYHRQEQTTHNSHLESALGKAVS
jgi:hypothetical protein